jgi:hypothetical protein
MIRHFCNWFVWLAVIFLPAEISLRADTANDDLAKSAIFEKNVLYLRVGNVGKNLAEEIQSAQNTLMATNKIIGTVLDLRFADGDDADSAKAAADLLASEKLPLAILVNGETRGTATDLAADLRAARAGLIFGGATKNLQPDVLISVNAEAEEKFLKNPFGTLAQSETNSTSSTNDLLPFVDHTSEADLVREKIKDGDEDENSAPPNAELQKPFIRDPVLARGADFVKGLAILRQGHS